MPLKNLLNLLGDKLHTLPLTILYLTDGCNSRCVTCDIWKNPRRNMAMAMVEEIATELETLGARWVLLSGGEAMQHPQWPQIARRFREAGLYVMLLTNGLLVRKQAQEVIDSVDELIVSLDGGTAPTYEAIRGVDGFDLILEGIRSVRAGGIAVTTRTTVQAANFREIPQIIAAALAADVNLVSFLPVDVSNEFAFGNRFTNDEVIPLIANGMGSPPEHGPPALSLSLAEIDALSDIIEATTIQYADAFSNGRMAESPEKLRRILIDYFRALHNIQPFPQVRCNAPHFSTVIEVDGTLRPCYFLPGYGRLRPQTKADGRVGLAEPLQAAVNSAAAQALRKAYRTGARPECARCVCPLYKGPRALLRM